MNLLPTKLSNTQKLNLRRQFKTELGLSKFVSDKKLAETIGVEEQYLYDAMTDAYNATATEFNNQLDRQRAVVRREKRRQDAIDKQTKSQVIEVKSLLPELYNLVKDAKENNKLIKIRFILDDGEVIRDVNINTSLKLHDLWVIVRYNFMWDSELDLFDVYDGKGSINGDTRVGKMFIEYGNTVVPSQRIVQAFFDGKMNCVMTPILNFINDKIETSKTKKTIQNYQSVLKKAVHLENKYHNCGVNADALIDIANELQIDLHVNLPFQKDFLVAKSNKRPLRTFHFVNTRLNHVDFDEMTHNEKEEVVSLEILKQIQTDFDAKNIYYTYKKNGSNISQIDTTTCRYKLTNEYRDAIFEFEKETGLIHSKICSIRDKDLHEFVCQGNHFNETIELFEREYEEISKVVEFDNHIDMKCAYGNYKMCKHYQGFIGKITDFRKCDHIVGVGLYQIKNLVLNGRLKHLNITLNCYNDNVYPSPELEMLKHEGCSFDIVAGCWGVEVDFVFSDALINKKDENGIRYYCKYVGQMFCKNETTSYYIKADKGFIQHLANEIDASVSIFGNEAKITYAKSSNYTLPQVSAFITSYMRMNMVEQLFEFDIKNVLKIVVDGVYFNGDCPSLKNCFQEKKTNWVHNCGGVSYMSNHICEQDFVCGEFKEHNMVEVHVGAGGCGKTHVNLIDKGCVGIVYFAPSWKLARCKQKEYGCRVNTIARLLCDDPETTNMFKMTTNTLAIDEVSMLSNEDKEKIMKNYDGCKIIFCGDVGFQLPCFEKGSTPFNLNGMKIIQYHTNHRVKCDKLGSLLQDMRQHIKENKNPRYLIENLCKKGNLNCYNYIEDLILSQTHVEKDAYTEKFKHLEKYYITKSDRVYGRGEILFDKPTTQDYKIQHAFTVHSIQGETANGNLYIDFERMYNPQMLYTAISRAKYLHQIILI